MCYMCLNRYCDEAFPVDGGYILTATGAHGSPPLPPVLDFNCRKRHFDQTLDHFGQSDQRRFKQTFWVCDSAWPQSTRKQVSSPTYGLKGV
jgi:hypothetical protein